MIASSRNLQLLCVCGGPHDGIDVRCSCDEGCFVSAGGNFPTRCACPYCHTRRRVVDGKLEEHPIVISEISDDQRATCTLTYRCPASGAEVSEWKDIP